MRCILLILITAWSILPGAAQVVVYKGSDSAELSIGGYVDAYFGYDGNKPENKNRPYAISSNRHDEIAVNLAYIQVKYTASRMRVNITPAFGTIMEINYAQEPPLMKNLYEAYAGFRPFAKSKFWLDAGIFAAPYANESAVSMDHFAYTRSNGCENTPYYLSGIRGTLPIHQKLSAQVFVINGWQLIQSDHHLQSFGTYVEYKPIEKIQFNWCTFFGNVYNDSFPNYGNRYYSDGSVLWNMNGNSSATACAGYGIQNIHEDSGGMSTKNWWHAAVQFRQKINEAHSLAAKVDLFYDKNGVLVPSINPEAGISQPAGVEITSFTLNYTYSFSKQVQFRIEGRSQFGRSPIYINNAGNPTRVSHLIISSLAARF